MTDTSKIRPVMVLPMNGSERNGVQVNEIYLPSGLRCFTVNGLGTYAEHAVAGLFLTEHEAFTHAFVQAGWNVQATERYTDDPIDSET